MTTTDLEMSGREYLSFRAVGPWAHFRRIDTTTEKLTYRVIPRTTVAGLIAAILGEPRDSYYQTFAPEQSAIAITPECRLETQSIPMLTLPTKGGNIKGASGVSGKTVVDPKLIATERKRRTFEYIVDPAYRIDVVLDDTETFDRLREYLQTDRAVYTPALGKSECLASIEQIDHGIVKPGNQTDSIGSIVPEDHVVPTPGTPLRMERTPAYMAADEGGRRTTGFLSYAYAPGGETLDAPDAPVHRVGGRTVCFV